MRGRIRTRVNFEWKKHHNHYSNRRCITTMQRNPLMLSINLRLLFVTGPRTVRDVYYQANVMGYLPAAKAHVCPALQLEGGAPLIFIDNQSRTSSQQRFSRMKLQYVFSIITVSLVLTIFLQCCSGSGLNVHALHPLLNLRVEHLSSPDRKL